MNGFHLDIFPILFFVAFLIIHLFFKHKDVEPENQFK
jgi:hypothetical protein